MKTIGHEIRYALRLLRKHPAYTLIAVLTIALGIGANSAIFNVVNAAMIRPLPYADASRLVVVGETNQHAPYPGQVSYIDYQELRQQNKSLDAMAGFGYKPALLTGYGDPEMLHGARVTASFLSVLGVNPAMGRNFTAEEESGAGAPAVILTDSLWRKRFQADAGIVGKTIRFDDVLYTVVGVLPADFHFAKLATASIYFPLRADQREKERRYFHWMFAFGHLKPGITMEQAQSDLSAVAKQFAATDPKFHATSGLGVVNLQRDIVGKYQPILLMLLTAVALVLLIACANVANLMMARTSSRQKEIATRSALGASRWQIARLLLVESTVLACMGAVLGVAWAYWCNQALTGAIPERIRLSAPFLDRTTLDLRVILFAAALSLVCGLLFGALPALRFSRTDVNMILKSASSTTSGARSFMYDSLIVGEVAMALMLLVGAGLLSLSLSRLLHADPGFDATGIVSTNVTVPLSYRSDAEILGFHRNLMDKLRSLPGVEGVATTDSLPLTGNGGTGSPEVVGRPPVQGRGYQVDVREVSAQYFSVMRIPVVSGRSFEERDTEQSSPAVIVNRQLASDLFPNQDPIGQRLKFMFTGKTEWEIVGVVGNESVRTLDTPNIPAFYFHYSSDRGLNLVIRTTTPAAVIPEIRSAIASLDPNVPVPEPITMQQVIDDSPSTFVHRYPAILLSGFGMLALVLALVGIYGVVSYGVAQRTREIGIRMALGARTAHVLDTILRRNVTLTFVGLALGTVGTLVLGRLLQGLLFGVSATNPLILAGSVVLLAAVSLLASYIPAHRATLVDPLVSLREQ